MHIKNRGFSLIEVLVSLLLIAVGLAAMANMINYSLNANTNASNRALATMMANEYAELVRSNSTEMTAATPVYLRAPTYTDIADAASRNVPNLPSGLCTYPNCTSNTLATLDVAFFQRRLRAALPAGEYEVIKVSNTQFDLWIYWMESSSVVSSSDTEQNSDNCPSGIRSLAADVRPRCYYMRVSI
ncbi:MAG: type IV pilus modification protein PilV [Anaerolineae bacterium]|nr:type IV pilus modification protein PilV [Anaerolineae bacterium]